MEHIDIKIDSTHLYLDDDIGATADQSSSNNSPFHSATEEQGMENAHSEGYREDDKDPLIFKRPSKPNVFHQFLTTAREKRRRARKPRHERLTNDPLPSPTVSSGRRQSENEPHHLSDSGEEGEDKGERQRQRQVARKGCSVGILLAAISCIFFSTSALIVKVSTLHPMELLCVRGLIQAILITPVVLSSGNSFLGPQGSRGFLLARAVLGSVSLVLSFASIHLISLADAATCIFTSPVFVSLFACLCLGELCSWFDTTVILLTLIGVILVSKPSFEFLTTGSLTSIMGTICGLSSACLTASAFIVLRQLRHVHYSVTVFWFSVVLAFFGAVLLIALDGFKVPVGWIESLHCIGIGLCGFLGQVLLTKALQIENAGPCAVARTLDIVLAFFYQITLLKDSPDWYSYLGSFFVVSSVLLTAFRKWYREKYLVDQEASMTDYNGHGGCQNPNGAINCHYVRANTNLS